MMGFIWSVYSLAQPGPRGHGVGVHCRRGIAGGHAWWHHARGVTGPRRGEHSPGAPCLLLLLHATSLDQLLLPHPQVLVRTHLVATAPHPAHRKTQDHTGSRSSDQEMMIELACQLASCSLVCHTPSERGSGDTP